MSEIPSPPRKPPHTWKAEFKISLSLQRAYFPSGSRDTLFHLDFISVNCIDSHKMDYNYFRCAPLSKNSIALHHVSPLLLNLLAPQCPSPAGRAEASVREVKICPSEARLVANLSL